MARSRVVECHSGGADGSDGVSNWPDFQLVSPELIWGVYPRLVGLVFLVSFSSLLPQVVPIAGREGSLPIRDRLQKITEAFPWWRRFVHYPTLLWINSSDAMLRGLIALGWLCAAAVIVGGPLGFWGMLGCYVVYISFDKPIGLIFPWDCVLFELGFLCLFLPQWHALPELTATATPAPLLVWALRLVVFRVMFGFGKAKFAESTKEDYGYLSGFLMNQPLPTKAAWYMHKLPLWVLKGAIFVMFMTEIPIPLLIFSPDLGVIAAAAIVGLMIAIQLCGSFGYFSLSMIVACVALLDTETPRQLDFSTLFSPGAPIFTNVVVLLQLFGAFLAFPFNSWVGQHWHHWVIFQRAPRWLVFPIGFYRFFHALRWVHPFGVFPPKTQPGVRTVPIMEVSWDGENWKEIDFPLACTRPEHAPRFISPHHARGDQAVIYETFGLNSQSLINGITSPGDPFIFTNYSGAHALLQRFMEGHYYPGVFTKKGAFDPNEPPPQWGRVRTFILYPTTIEEKRRTGAWWKRAYIGPHIPPMQKRDDFWTDWLPEPELWHWEMVIWRRRSYLKKLIQRGAAGEDSTRAIVADARGLSTEDVGRFWNEFLPAVRAYDRNDWSLIRDATLSLRERFGSDMRKFERILGRLCVMGSGKLDPLYLHRGKNPPIPAKNYARLWMAMQDVIWDGKEAFEAMLADPMSLKSRVDLPLERGLYFTAIFRYEALVFEAQKLRLIHNFVLSHYTPPTPARARWEERGRAFAARVTAFAEVFEFIQDKLKGAPFDEGYPELYPEYEFHQEGVVRLKEQSVRTWEPLPGMGPGGGVMAGGDLSGE